MPNGPWNTLNQIINLIQLYILENLKFEIQRDKSNKLYYSTMEIYYLENGIRKTFLKVSGRDKKIL